MRIWENSNWIEPEVQLLLRGHLENCDLHEVWENIIYMGIYSVHPLYISIELYDIMVKFKFLRKC